MKKLRFPAAAALCAVLSVTGCGGGHRQPVASTPTATPTPRIDKDGHLVFTLLTLRCGIAGVTGTHSEAQPEGQYCAARIRVANPDPEYHTYVTKDQRLEGVAEPRNHPDRFAMAVKRQAPEVQIGGTDLVEVELWFDVPVDAAVTGLRVQGDRDATGFMDNTVVKHAPDGLLIPATPAKG